MDPLSISASITALLQLTSTVIQYLNGVKGAPEDRQKILSELASVSGILYVLQDQAEQAKQGDQWSSTFQSLNVANGPLEHFRTALERLSSKLASPPTGLKKLGKAIVWPFQKEEIKEILGSIERQKALLTLARQNDHIKLAKAIKNDVAIMRDEVEEVAKGVSELQMNQITSEYQRIIDWLDVPDPSTNFNRALKDRNPKTGSWFIKSSQLADWKTTRGSLIWLHGIPGCGKTILSSTILQNVLDQYQAKPNTAVLFFYFDFNDAEKQRPEKMIRSLICQLSMCCEKSVLQNLYSSCLNGGRQPTCAVLLETFCQMMTSLEDTYIILDALDECAERDELLTDLEEIASWEDANWHVLATSRREKDIEEALTPLSDSRNRISIQSELVNADIRTYIHDRLKIDRKLKRWQKHPKVQVEIEDTLMSKVNGMFRWAACQLDSLRDCFNLPHLRQAMASLPKTLDDTYARILCNIDKHYHHYNRYILKILQWLAFSSRPLRLEEVVEIFAINIDETPRFDPERRLPEPREILTICSSLIALTSRAYNASDEESNTSDEESGSELSEESQNPDADTVAKVSNSKDSRTYVRLAHFSVQEYLLSDRIRHGMAPHYSIREIESHGVLAEDCIAYLLQFDEPGSLTPETLELSPLARYAARFWVKHAKLAEKGPIKTTALLSMELFMAEGESLLNWIRIFDPEDNIENLSRTLDSLAPPLYYASTAGLFEPVKMLIERGMNVNAQGGRWGNALQAASYWGRMEVVHLLLDNGADVNAQGGLYGNALQAASIQGQIEIVHLLLDNGADVNAQGGLYGNALQAALYWGRMEIVHLLLDNGADVNAQGGLYGNALQAASYWGRMEIVHLLLDNGAEVNAQGGEHGNALQAASIQGQIEIVHLLLDNGAEVNAQGGEHGNALVAACGHGWEKVVQLLLDKGAAVNVRGGRSQPSTLQAASNNGHENIVKMLLDKWTDVNARGEGRWSKSALELASKDGHENIVKMVLDKGADVNALSKKGSALQAASKSGHEKVVRMLLDNGADVNTGKDGSCGSKALRDASKYGHKSVVKLLKANGAVMPEEQSSISEQEDEWLSEEEYSGYEEDDDEPVEQVGDLNAATAPAVED